MAPALDKRTLVVLFMTLFFIWARGGVEPGSGDPDDDPGIIIANGDIGGNVEERETRVESVTEDLSSSTSDEEKREDDELTSERDGGRKEENEVVETDDVVVVTDHPGYLEPPTELPLATPPSNETTPTDQETTPTDSEVVDKESVEVSFETETTPPGDEGEGEGEKGEEEGDDVPTFTEFSQRKRMEQNSTQRPANEKPAVSTGQHNYASIDCGAKIIAVNDEAQNPSAILSENRDHYMINPCSAEIWFVVELCELVELHGLEIACFELFSSIPENFNVSVSERYPADEWRFLGMMHASNEREIQRFPLSAEEASYAKFLRVDMVSHYGSEHFCPLSLLRVNGSSMMEVYEYSESQQEASVESLSPTVAPSEGREKEDDLFGGVLEENISQHLEAGVPGTSLEGLFGSFLSVIETISGYMRHTEEDESTPPQNVTPEYPTSDLESESESVSPAVQHPTASHSHSEDGSVSQDIAISTDDVIITQTETDETSQDVSPTLDGVVKSTDHSDDKTHSIPSLEPVEHISETTPTMTDAPPAPTPTLSGSEDEATEPASGQVVENGTLLADSGTTVVQSGPTVVPDNGQESSVDDMDVDIMNGSSSSEEGEREGENGGTLADDLQLEEVVADREAPPETMTNETAERKEENGIEASPDSAVVVAGEGGGEEGEREGNGNSTNQAEVVGEAETAEDVASGPLAEEKGVDVEEVGEMEEKGVEGGDVVEKELSQETLTNGNGAVGLPGQPKEKSVFLRLSNRIRDLEENMSLFSSYLDQISTGMKRNKNRTEDGQKSLERRLNSLNDSLQLATNQTELALAVLFSLHGDVEDIRQAVQSISENMEQSRRELVWLVGLLVIVLTLLLTGSLTTILWLLCNKTTHSHDNNVTPTKAETSVDRVAVATTKPQSSANGICAVPRIKDKMSGLLGTTEGQQTLELHSDESQHSEQWSSVGRKRKKKPKTL